MNKNEKKDVTIKEEPVVATTTVEVTNLLDRQIVKVLYKHKIDPEVVITEEEIADAWKKQLNPADYEQVVITTTHRKILTEELFGDADYEVTSVDVYNAKVKYDNVRRLLPLTNPIRTPFQQEKAAAQARIQNVKSGAIKSVTLEQAKNELLAVYAKYDEVYVPRVKKSTEPVI